MTPIKRSLGAAGAAVLLAATLSACGGGPPTDASKGEFCDEVVNAEFDEDSFDPEASPEDQAKALKEEFDRLTDKAEEVGTPEDIPDDAREGFEIQIEKAQDLDEDDLQKAIEDQDDDFLEVSDDEQEKLDAFTEWSQEYCA